LVKDACSYHGLAPTVIFAGRLFSF
jgi:hypothetical protein